VSVTTLRSRQEERPNLRLGVSAGRRQKPLGKSSESYSEEVEWMSQSIRQAARKAALETQSRRRRELAERDRRLAKLAVQVLAELGEARAFSAEADGRAARALEAMTKVEGLTLREAAEWLGVDVSARDLARLARIGREGAPHGPKP
jgi:hypothetical protein